jgi:hypothetical protein
MAIPSYAFLKLKITRPAGVITMEAKAQWVLDCKKNNIELTATVVAATKLKEMCLSALPSLANPAMPSTSGTFKAAKDAKAIQVNDEDLTKTVQVRAGLSPK